MSEAKVLSREEILGQNDLPIHTEAVPEWNGNLVRIRTMPGNVREEFDKSIRLPAAEQAAFTGAATKEARAAALREAVVKIDTSEMKVRLLALTLVDQDGKLLFSMDDIAALNEKNCAVINRLFTIAQRLNGLGDEAVEDLAKNLSTDQSDKPGSDSLANEGHQSEKHSSQSTAKSSRNGKHTTR